MANGNYVSEAYALYCRHGVISGTPLSQAEFEEFWCALSESDQQYWLAELEAGKTELDRAWLFEDEVQFEERDRQLLELAQRCSKH